MTNSVLPDCILCWQIGNTTDIMACLECSQTDFPHMKIHVSNLIYLFDLEFYVQVNTVKVMLSWPVHLITLFPGQA